MCPPTNGKQPFVEIEEKIPRAKTAHCLIGGTACAHPAKTFSRQRKKDPREDGQEEERKKEVKKDEEEEEKKKKKKPCQADQRNTNRNENKREKLSMNNDKRGVGGDADEGASGSGDRRDDGETRPSKQTQGNQLDRKDDPTVTPPQSADKQGSGQSVQSAQSAQRRTTKGMAESSCHKKRKVISAVTPPREGSAHTSDLLSGEIHEGKSFFSTGDESPFCHMYSPRNVAAQIGNPPKDGAPAGSSGGSGGSSGSSSGSSTPPEDKGKLSRSGSDAADDLMDGPLVSSTSGKVLPNKQQIENFILSVEKTCSGEKKKNKKSQISQKSQKRRTSLASTKREVTKRSSFLAGLSPDENLMEDDNEDGKADPFCNHHFCYDSNIIYQTDERNYEDGGSYRQSLNPGGEMAFSLNGDDLFDEAERDAAQRYAPSARGKSEKNFFELQEEDPLLQREKSGGTQPTYPLEKKEAAAKEKCTMEGEEATHAHHMETHTSSSPLLNDTPYDLSQSYKGTHLYGELEAYKTNFQKNPYSSKENLMKLLNSKIEDYDGGEAVENEKEEAGEGKSDGGDPNKLCQSSETNQNKQRKYERNFFINLASQQMNGDIVNYTNECPLLGCIPDGYPNVSTPSGHLVDTSEQNPFCLGENVKSTFMQNVLKNKLNIAIDSPLINDNEPVKKKYDLQINGFKIYEQIDALYQRKETNQEPTGCSNSLLEMCSCNASFVGSSGEGKGLPLCEDSLVQVSHLHRGEEPSSAGGNYQEVAKKKDSLFQHDHMRGVAHVKKCVQNEGQPNGEEENDGVEDAANDGAANDGDGSAKQLGEGQPPAGIPSRREPRPGVPNDDCSPGDDPHKATTGDLPQRGGLIVGNSAVGVEKDQQIGDAVISSVTFPVGKDHDALGRQHSVRSHPGEDVSGVSMPYSKGEKGTTHEGEDCTTLHFEEIYLADDLTTCPESGLTVCASLEQPGGPEKREPSNPSNSSRSSVSTADGRAEGEGPPTQRCAEEDESGMAGLDVQSGDLPSGSLFQFVTRGASDGSLSEEQEEEVVGLLEEKGVNLLKDPVEELDQRKDDIARVHTPEGEEGTCLGSQKNGDEGEGANRIEESAQTEPVRKAGRSKGSANKPDGGGKKALDEARGGGALSGPRPVSQLAEGSSFGFNKRGAVEGDTANVDTSRADKVDDAELTCNGQSEGGGNRESERVPTLRVINEKEGPVNGAATPSDDPPIGGKNEEGSVSLYANHRVEAEKLNQDIPYITNIHKEMHRSPVMPLRIEAFHSLEDQRLIYGRPEWQKYLCPLCDKAYYPPNSYVKNYTHYLNEHWKKRKILGGYIIFPCKLIHNGLEEEEAEKEKTTYLRISKKMKKKKKKKTFYRSALPLSYMSKCALHRIRFANGALHEIA
ncbi:hypothetical protein PVNG_01447 [Plasmodium vivax North Korean]|uniref:Uncharacterized protein n=1 Tax=Plasmodium vivax North Korean TaxID=1035514 RepID=A0A0J9U2L6_PLAVI|nr:hypothetical protein PVNG_01447 [Plasmodium vivax North Korean]